MYKERKRDNMSESLEIIKPKNIDTKCPKCEFIGTMYRDDDRKNGIRVVACIVCGKRIYESGAKIKVRKRTNRKRSVR